MRNTGTQVSEQPIKILYSCTVILHRCKLLDTVWAQRHTERSGLKATSLHWEGSCSSLTGLQSSDLEDVEPSDSSLTEVPKCLLNITNSCMYCVGREGKAPKPGKLSPTSLNESTVQPNTLCFDHKTGSPLNNNIRQASMKFCTNKTKIKSR